MLKALIKSELKRVLQDPAYEYSKILRKEYREQIEEQVRAEVLRLVSEDRQVLKKQLDKFMEDFAESEHFRLKLNEQVNTQLTHKIIEDAMESRREELLERLDVDLIGKALQLKYINAMMIGGS